MRKLLAGAVIIVSLFIPRSAAVGQSALPPDPQPPEASLMGAEIVERAKGWVDAAVPYNQAGYRDGYRTDCAGFVSFAWQVHNPDGQIHSPDGVSLATQYGSPVSFDLLAPGDILDNLRYGNEGHVVMFVRWVEKGAVFEAYEENGGENYNKAVATRLTLRPSKSGGMTIDEYEPFAAGPYYAYRSNGIPGYAVVTAPPCVWKTPGECLNQVTVGEEVNASFTIRNDGGQALVITQLLAGTRGPWARVQGWYGPNADFPPDLNLILMPGQTYSYSRARSFSLVGDYFTEAVLNADGWQAVTPWPRISFDVMKPN